GRCARSRIHARALAAPRMSVYKMVEVVGTSGTSLSDAIRGAVERASMTLEDVSWFEVSEIRGQVKDGEVSEYQVKLDVGFLLHAPKKETGATGSARQDDERYQIRFTPRKSTSHWSNVNVERVAALRKEGRMTPAGERAFAARQAERTGRAAYELSPTALAPAEEKTFQKDKNAWTAFHA